MKVIYAATLLCFALAGCASAPSVPLSPEVQHLEHQFILVNDDRSLREGANPTYALLEFGPGGYKLLALSKSYIQMTRANQEELFISNGFTNVVPAWTGYSIKYKEDPITGKRTNYVFEGGNVDRKIAYSPASSNFVYSVGQQVMPTLAGYGIARYYGLSISEVGKSIAQTNLLDEARAWNSGAKRYPGVAPQIVPLTLSRQVWLLINSGDGETGRYYFVPTKLTTQYGEYVDASANVYFKHVEGIVTDVKTPIGDMKRFKVYGYSKRTAGDNFSCARAIMDIGAQTNLEQRFCGNSSDDGLWSLPLLYAQSPAISGEIKVLTVEGQAYNQNGTKRPIQSLGMNVGQRYGIQEFHVLPPAEAERVLATFR
ncbi:MAG: hypothetical protein JWQ10_4117 [Herbaspirillum sp.]|nr:hypothetical protein [Herbaspirillum sp.]